MFGVTSLPATGPIGHSILGIIIPASIFIISFIATWLLHRHFSKP
jgi:hypothetical protein